MIAEFANDFEDFAPCGEHPAAATFVVIHGLHEFHFVTGIIPFARRRINLPTSFYLDPPLANPPLFADEVRLGFRLTTFHNCASFFATLFEYRG